MSRIPHAIAFLSSHYALLTFFFCSFFLRFLQQARVLRPNKLSVGKNSSLNISQVLILITPNASLSRQVRSQAWSKGLREKHQEAKLPLAKAGPQVPAAFASAVA